MVLYPFTPMILCYRCFEEDVFRPGLVVLYVVTWF